MTGALDSGKDVLIEVSAGYVERIVSARLYDLDTGCFEAQNVPIRYRGQNIVIDAVRRTIIEVESASFSHQIAVDVISGVFLNLQLRLLYAQVLIRVLFGENWKTLDELGVTDDDRLLSTSIRLQVSAELERVVLTLDPTSLPDYLPDDLVETLSEAIPIPVNFLNQSQTFQDEAGSVQVVNLLTATLNSAEIKSVDGGHLVIGLDLQLAQDDDLRVLGPSVPRDVDPIVAGSNDLVRHDCGLPQQPEITLQDVARFRMDFAESFLEESDWAVALDKHIVDAVLRGLPSADMADEGEPRSELCVAENAVRGFCLRVDDLDTDLIHVRGSGEVFICPLPEGFGPLEDLYNDYWEVCVEADVTVGFSAAGRLVAHYDLTSVRPCGDDGGFRVWVDLFDVDLLSRVPANFRSRDLALSSVPTSIGERDDPAGRLTIEHVQVREDGLVFRGSGSIQPPALSIGAPGVVMFATGCQGAGVASSATFSIRNTGVGDVHVCPVVLHRHPRYEEDNSALFRVTEPPELLDNGQGLVLARNEHTEITVECSGAPGSPYYAVLDVPTTAGPVTIPLIADFRESTLGPTVDEIRLENEYVKVGCHWPPYRLMTYDLEITNEGPGHMQICSIQFSANIRDVFRASNPGVFRPGPAVITVTFAPFIADDTEYDGTMRITTNSGETREIDVFGHTRYTLDVLTERLSGSYQLELFCGDADWDAIQDTNGRIIDVKEMEDFLTFLGGKDCCPPPRGPACLCVDLLQIDVADVRPEIGLEIVDPEGQPVLSHYATTTSRQLIAPVKPGHGYALRARIPQRIGAGLSSRLMLRRWIAQQDNVYASGQRLNDLAISGDHVYLAGNQGIEVVSLADPGNPTRTHFVKISGGSRSLTIVGSHLLAARKDLTVYRLDGSRLVPTTGIVASEDGFSSVLSPALSPAAVAYAIDRRLMILDLADPQRPRVAGQVATRIRATGATVNTHCLCLFGTNGIELFDLSKPERPRAVGLLRAERAIDHAIFAGSTLVLLSAGGPARLVDVSNPEQPVTSGEWRLEEWVSPFVPRSGSVLRHRQYFVLLQGDRRGIRLMRLRLNEVVPKMRHRV